MPEPDGGRVTLAAAREAIADLLVRHGATVGAAGAVAADLVQAEAEGQAAHGFSRLADYAGQLRSGKINAAADVRTRTLATAVVETDADCGFASPALDAAIAARIPLACRHGVAVMSVTNSHHCGALSVQVGKIARRGLIGLMMANTPKAMAPWGTHEPVFGTNPLAFAVPRPDGDDLVIDLSLSVTARGKIRRAAQRGQRLAAGQALDAEGRPTTDPDAALAGSLLPVGGPKGAALALMVEILAATWTSSAASREAESFFTAHGPPPRTGQFLMALVPNPGFADRLAALLAAVEGLPGARLPGSRGRAARRETEARGVVYRDLRAALDRAEDPRDGAAVPSCA